ncbi:zinc transporter ZIP11 isoform X1 [Bufo gargarizans]|uniref:zinc transporter ZIP11 isoform X1 n=1 Tax=Bufo gargarizans TaxID=30331 RepID=UPI001CF15C44|nr:zinc transporter ZIP11 isoform X1 [Bufo gargarizans]
MIEGYSPVIQALLGTLFTWGLTAAGSALVFVFATGQRRILDGSLGFAAGVMLAASYWSLLAPAIEMSSQYGSWSFLPAAVGFSLGAGFVYLADKLLPALGLNDDPFSIPTSNYDFKPVKEKDEGLSYEDRELSIRIGRGTSRTDKIENGDVHQRRRGVPSPLAEDLSTPGPRDPSHNVSSSWRRIMLLILAITIHNIPEGLAVGVGFGAIGKTASATFESARNLAVGIGIQNFPEGLAVSLPLRGAGVSTWKAFWYGQLSGMVEPIAGVLGAVAIALAEPLLPYALAFAAGAMVYVVMDDIIPEAQTGGNGKLASWTCILGFVVMMSLDVGLS